MTKVFRTSWSMLSTFEREGFTQKIIDMVQGRRTFVPTPQMKLGTKWHEYFEEETFKTSKVPVAMGYDIPGPWEVERKYVCDLDKGIVIAGVLDRVKPPYIVDIKVGRTDVGFLIRSRQIPLYANFYGFDTIKFGAVESVNPYIIKANNEQGIETYKGAIEIEVRHLTKAVKKEAWDWAKENANKILKECKSRNIPYWRIEEF